MEQIAKNIYKLNVDSNIYFLDLDKKIIIDAGPEDYKDIVQKEIKKLIGPEKIDIVIFTHLHYDHIGNFDLFNNAKFYASEEEISYFRKNPFFAVFNQQLAKKFSIKLNPLEELNLNDFELIKTPGHTKGSICLYYKKEKILFSGDTLFNNGVGRTDLPNSEDEKMPLSLNLLKKIDYKILAPGHDY